MQKLLIVSHEKHLLCLEYTDKRLSGIRIINDTSGSLLGNVYVGRVSKMMANLQACFVDISRNVTGFLPLSNVVNPILANRVYDGTIKQGDIIVVQIEKDTVKTKQPVLKTNISISGLYVIMETADGSTGISNKLDKKCKDDILSYLVENKMINPDKKILDGEEHSLPFSAIIRTNAGNPANYEALKSEWNYLKDTLKNIAEYGLHQSLFTCLYKASDPIIECLKNYYHECYEEIITDIPDIYEKLQNTEKVKIPVRLYRDEYALKKLYNVESEIERALESRIWLKSGAYLILEYTEALTIIDVNSGKKQASKDNQQNFFEINMEAAHEIMFQLKLRNISGMILIDFINMENDAQYLELMNLLRELAKKDSVKTAVIDLTKLGLVEMTRKRIGRPIKELL